MLEIFFVALFNVITLFPIISMHLKTMGKSQDAKKRLESHESRKSNNINPRKSLQILEDDEEIPDIEFEAE